MKAVLGGIRRPKSLAAQSYTMSEEAAHRVNHGVGSENYRPDMDMPITFEMKNQLTGKCERRGVIQRNCRKN
jgi:hypothetical protein